MEIEILRDNIKNKNYGEAIKLVKKEIISELEEEIRVNNPHFKYTNVYNLINASNKYIDGNKKNIARCLYTPEYIDMDEKDELISLLENYKILTC